MNTLVKGSVAGAAGIALLMGGYGTFAVWTDSTGVAGGSITSGQLDIEAGTQVWDDLSTTAANDWDATSLLVPGDKVSMTQTFDITATGTNLAGTLEFSPGTFAAGDFGADLTHSVAVQTTDGLTVDTTDKNLWVFSSPLGVQSAAVTAKVTYTFGSSADNATQNATATLSDGTFTISQTPVTTTP
jgi:alternate signal-mediated exported protein